MREFDREYNEEKSYNKEKMFGVWDGTRWNYSNGLYAIPKEKDKRGRWTLELFSKDGKKLDEGELMDISNWNDGFVRVEYKYLEVDKHYDRSGKCITCLGVFCEDDECGKNLYVVPYHKDKMYLYNHKECFLVGEKYYGTAMLFDGFKGITGDNGEKLILATVTGLSESNGFGTLREIKYYDKFFQIDLDGNILKTWNEWKTEDGKTYCSST